MHRTHFRRASLATALAAAAVGATLALSAPAAAGIDDNPDGDSTKTTQSEDRHPYYVNCTQVRRETNGPLMRGEPGYRRGLDKDNDGIACN
ncbi:MULTISPECIES: excalibur calcium-binding domain-containing protein [unclassified Nocardia]|uniref:excalibur calcium-binding domain-containing protein n=1 Tax=unclassified Nocardia TaxID=2637762 RepID=UPI0024A869F7|nr:MULTISPECIES: excalibur calcium-binding domain-containing protein [unclassified Nocardia]